MNKAVKQHDKEQAEGLRFSPEVLKAIEAEFEIGRYLSKEEIKQRLKAIYKAYSIEHKVTQDTIKDYFDTTQSNSRDKPSYKLLCFNPQR